jgi:hypothetical protein
MPSTKEVPFGMLNKVTASMATLIIHLTPHLVINLSEYLLAPTIAVLIINDIHMHHTHRLSVRIRQKLRNEHKLSEEQPLGLGL